MNGTENPDLLDLIRSPVESEPLELKCWIDLTKNEKRASIARHLAAISNYGGGYLIFGFNDDGTRCAPEAGVRLLYSQDTIAGIIAKYLQPVFQCQVKFETHDGVEHPIVWVPSHKATPVISKADGPHDHKGVPQEIRIATIYVRTPKPESVPISTPDQLSQIIQRCVLARRDEIVGMVSTILSGTNMSETPKTPAIAKARDDLRIWHSATQSAFLQAVNRLDPEPRLWLNENFVQFSYLIQKRDGSTVAPENLIDMIGKINNAVRDTVHYGRSMFLPYTSTDITPRFTTDPLLGDGELEFVQTSLIRDGKGNRFDLWRISPDGRASLIRNFQEDYFGKRPDEIADDAKWFDPWLHVRDITEVVRHAWAFSEEFNDVSGICFVIEYRGLQSRITASLNPQRYYGQHVCQSDQRTVASCFPQAELIGSLPSVVSKLYSPIHRMFNPREHVTSEWIRSMMAEFVM